MADRKRVNGIPVPGGLTHAEYMKAWRAANTVEALKEMGKKPDPKWLRMFKDARAYEVLGLALLVCGVVEALLV